MNKPIWIYARLEHCHPHRKDAGTYLAVYRNKADAEDPARLPLITFALTNEQLTGLAIEAGLKSTDISAG